MCYESVYIIILYIHVLTAMAVRYGSKNVYQSMSRAISLWLDLGSDIANKLLKERMNQEAKETLKNQHSTLSLVHTEVRGRFSSGEDTLWLFSVGVLFDGERVKMNMFFFI